MGAEPPWWEQLTEIGVGSMGRCNIFREKSAVTRPWRSTFLGYSFTSHHRVQPKVARESVKRLKAKLRPILRRGRGWNLARVIFEISRILRGWIQYFRLSEVKAAFEELDAWISRKLRYIIWRQWKTPRTRFRKLQALGVNQVKVARAAWGRDGPWRSAAQPRVAGVQAHLRRARGPTTASER